MHWRAMTLSDMARVVRIAAVVHPGFHEDRAVFVERQQLFPCGAKLLETDGRAVGYALSHPWNESELPALNTLLGRLPDVSTTFYLHDVALLPAARGCAAAGALVGSLASLARALAYPSMTLVAVNGSRRFWEKHGFHIIERPGMSAKLASYEETAVMMQKNLA